MGSVHVGGTVMPAAGAVGAGAVAAGIPTSETTSWALAVTPSAEALIALSPGTHAIQTCVVATPCEPVTDAMSVQLSCVLANGMRVHVTVFPAIVPPLASVTRAEISVCFSQAIGDDGSVIVNFVAATVVGAGVDVAAGIP